MSTDNVRELIKRAAKQAGSEYKLAKMLGVAQQRITNWKDEDGITCSPADRARLAAIAGEDAVQELVRATLEKHEGTLRGEQLRQVLGKRLQAIGGASTTGAAVALSLASLTATSSAQLLRCLLLLTTGKLAAASILKI